MPITTLDATAGSATANTYCLLTVADQYHLDRPASGTTWADASDDEKDTGLLMATRVFDDLFVWTGLVVDDTQALLWPRVGMIDHTELYSVSTTAIPTELQHATAELARQLLADIARTDDSAIESLGITSLKAGPVFLQFSSDVTAKVIPDLVAHMLPSHWYSRIRGRSSGSRELVRV